MNPEHEPVLTMKQIASEEAVDEVLYTKGLIPASAVLEPVRCPFEDLIQASELDVPLCKHAQTCRLDGCLDLCTVPHIHNYWSPGAHILTKAKTITKGFTLKDALAKVAKKTGQVKRMKAAGKVLVKPKRLPRKLTQGPAPVDPGLKTKAEVYSVYEYDATPPEHEKYDPPQTKADRWLRADARESKRLQIIQDGRDMKIDAMLG